MSKVYSKLGILLFCFLCVTVSSTAQDHISWSSIQLNKKIDAHWSVFLKPIVRHNLSNGQYLNWSPDYAVNYTFTKNWRAMILGRTWFMPNRDNRQFIFYDIKHQKKFTHFTLRNTLRYHQAFDIGSFTDPDFLRWHPSVSFNAYKKLEPLLGTQVFYRVNGINNIQRVRIVLGLTYLAHPRYKIAVTYWDEIGYNLESNIRTPIWVINLNYKL